MIFHHRDQCFDFLQCFDTAAEKEGHPARKKPVPLIAKGSLLEQVEEQNQLSQVHVENCQVKTDVVVALVIIITTL